MSELLQYAIDYAERGFPVTQVIASGWAASARNYMSPSVMSEITTFGQYPEAFNGYKNVR
jgi:gamma-glutamyltranspeptidase